MSSLLIGGKSQEWVNRGARERWFARYSATISFALLIVVIFQAAMIAYLAWRPSEIPVVVAQQRDGSYAPYAEQAPNDAGKIKLLSDWVADWRLGSSDPKSLPARQTAALIPTGPDSDAVASQVRDYYQQVLDGGLTIAPTVRSVVCSGYDCAVDWDESVTSSLKVTQRAMRAYVTIAFDDRHVNLHNDPLTHPYGMYLRSLRVVEVNVGHAR